MALSGLFVGCSSTTTSTTSSTSTVATDSSRPCDIFKTATPCVAAYSTTRALFAAYTGSLYQVTRSSDKTTLDIGLLTDGYANAASQDTFCTGTTCTITKIYDQSSEHNDLTVAPPGGAASGAGPSGYDLPAVANALPIKVGGHSAYGISIVPGMGYRNDTAKGTAVNGAPESVYMLTSAISSSLNGRCCFDFGNAEKNDHDNGAGHMDAISMYCPGGGTPCPSHGGIDMENGIYGDLTIPVGTAFAVDMAANDGQKTYTMWEGNTQIRGLSSTGALALPAGYAPMAQEGSIILGIGGDNSNTDSGYFFEGVMTQGAPTDAVMNSVQNNIYSANYATH